MKKLWLLAGIGIGFVLGSRAGREPYDQLEGKVRRFRGRPEVQGAVDVATGKLHEQANGLADKVSAPQ
jgi:hypothetical protein